MSKFASSDKSVVKNHCENLKQAAQFFLEPFFLVDQESTIIWSNRPWQILTGEPMAHEQLTFPLIGAIHEDDKTRLTELWSTTRLSQKPLTVEVRLKRVADQQFLWHEVKIVPIIASDNKLQCWSVLCSDIHKLKTTQNMFQVVMDNIPISIFWKDLNSHFLGCNSQFAADVCSTTVDIVGKCDYDNPSTREESEFFIECDRRVIASGIPEYHIIEPQLRADGKQAWLDTSKIPLRDAGGAIVGILGMYEDITARITIEQQREDFIATLTHDLKNPLLGTNRIIDLLLSGRVSAEECKNLGLLEQMKASNNSLILMIQNLLDVYRFDTVMRLPDQNAVNLNQLLKEAAKLNEFAAQAKKINLTIDLPVEQCYAEINHPAVTRVVQNLLDNAIKFTPEQGSICLILKKRDSHCDIQIKDDGSGIDSDEQKQLFNRFWQGTPGKKYSHGTGLGLYLCKQIVEAHRGTIACASIAGEGSTFTVTLPAKSMNPVVSL
jgi:PAS domain S-box-containing protein